MGLPALLSSSDRTPSTWSKASGFEADIPPDLIYDEAQLPCIPPERPDLRELNQCLEALAVVFPDVQAEVFRELLGNFDGESRLALVADALLKNRVAWVKGRWKAITPTPGSDGPAAALPRADMFRSGEYKKAARALAQQEFKGLSRSTINAVLAESNHSYLDARRTLVTLSSRSWRFAISSILMRRKPVDSEHHPLVRWRTVGAGQGSFPTDVLAIPTIRATGSAELDRELYEALVVPIKRRAREEREAQDREMAARINGEEADEACATHECACCFTAGPFEEFTQCNRDAHMICFRCVRLSIKEALFGQGWLSSIAPETGTLRCMAVDADECGGAISAEHMRRAMAGEDKGGEVLDRLDQRLAEHALLASGVPLIRCPFCSYSEVDDVYLPADDGAARPRVRLAGASGALLVLLAACAAPCVLLLAMPLALASLALCLALMTTPAPRTAWARASREWSSAVSRHRRRRRGQRFSCGNPRCLRPSCLSCGKAWADVHVCNESSLVALRTQVEQAMSMAIKRVCPRCSTSFVKNAGCNKLTCPCGYKMCYVCRADLADEGYRHFCDHFRPDADPRTPCPDCDRCNLWESEDTDRVLREAREEAESKWRDAERRELSTQEVAFLETGIASGLRGRVLSLDGLPSSVAEVFDMLVEAIFD